MSEKAQNSFNLNGALAGIAILGSIVLFRKLMKLENQVHQNNDQF